MTLTDYNMEFPLAPLRFDRIRRLHQEPRPWTGCGSRTVAAATRPRSAVCPPNDRVPASAVRKWPAILPSAEKCAETVVKAGEWGDSTSLLALAHCANAEFRVWAHQPKTQDRDSVPEIDQ